MRVVKPTRAREVDHLMRRRQAVRLAARAAIAARDTAVAARPAAFWAFPHSRRDRVLDVFAVTVPQAHAAKRERVAPPSPARVVRAKHVRLNSLLPAPVARYPELGVVHSATNGVPTRFEIHVCQGQEFYGLGFSAPALRLRARDVVVVVVVVVVRFALRGVVNLRAIARRSATLRLRYEDSRFRRSALWETGVGAISGERVIVFWRESAIAR